MRICPVDEKKVRVLLPTKLEDGTWAAPFSVLLRKREDHLTPMFDYLGRVSRFSRVDA